MPFRAFSVFVRRGYRWRSRDFQKSLNALSGIQCIRTLKKSADGEHQVSSLNALSGIQCIRTTSSIFGDGELERVLMPFRAFSVFVRRGAIDPGEADGQES